MPAPVDSSPGSLNLTLNKEEDARSETLETKTECFKPEYERALTEV